MSAWTQAKMDRFMHAEAKVFGPFLTSHQYVNATGFFDWLGVDIKEWLDDEETVETARACCGSLAKALRTVGSDTFVAPEMTGQLLDWSIYAVVLKLSEERVRTSPKLETQA